jgi:hypothetical protein
MCRRNLFFAGFLKFVFLLAFFASAFGGTKSPACLRPFARDIIENEVLTKSEKNLFFRTVDTMDARGKTGAIVILGLNDSAIEADVAFEIMLAPNTSGFSHLYPDANSLYGAIGDIASLETGVIKGPKGFEGQLRVLGGGNAAAAAGVELDFKIAQDAGAGNVLSFQESLNSPSGVSRRYDVATKCDTCSLGMLYHEDKNWGFPLDGANDSRLQGLLTQFDNDILIHGATDFDSFRLNLRTTVQAQDDLIFQQLLSRFDSDVVKGVLDATEIARRKSVFQKLWQSLRTYK